MFCNLWDWMVHVDILNILRNTQLSSWSVQNVQNVLINIVKIFWIFFWIFSKYSKYSYEYSIIFLLSKAPLISTLNMRSAFRLNQSHKTSKSILTLGNLHEFISGWFHHFLCVSGVKICQWVNDQGRWLVVLEILTFPHRSSVCCNFHPQSLFSFHFLIFFVNNFISQLPEDILKASPGRQGENGIPKMLQRWDWKFKTKKP